MSAGDKSQGNMDLVLGQLALNQRLITQEHLRAALAEQSRELEERGRARPLGEILVAKELLTRHELDSLLSGQADERKAKRPLINKAFGRYTLLRELGRGGMGVVYEAYDNTVERKVALKMMLPVPGMDTEDATNEEQRFVREAKLSARLPHHPNIVSVFDAGVVEGQRFLAMEFVEGQRMDRWRKTARASLKQQIALLESVVRAVHHAHDAGIFHRDLKPANILVDAQNQPRVTDFGLAKTVDETRASTLTASGMAVGTPVYMSPEQAKGLKTIDFRTDIYALGVMLFEILTNRVPFDGSSPLAILRKIVDDPTPLPSHWGRGIDKGIENICLKALQKKPALRYQKAKDFADDLSRWLKGELAHAPEPTRRKVVSGKPKKPSLVWAYGGGALALVAGLAVVLLSSGSGDAPVPPPKSGPRPSIARPGPKPSRPDNAVVHLGLRRLEEARRHSASTTKELVDKIKLYDKAIWDLEVRKDDQAVAQQERDQLAARLTPLLDGEFQIEMKEVFPPWNRQEYQAALDRLEEAKKLHDVAEWRARVEEKVAAIGKEVKERYATLKDEALKARLAGNEKEVRMHTKRVAKWGLASYVTNLKDHLAGIVVNDPPPVAAPKPPPVPAAVAVAGNRTESIGGRGGSDFEETPEGSRLIVGFRYGFGAVFQRRVIKSIQALYATPAGRKDGLMHGKPEGPVQEIAARTGYAVGGIRACGERRVWGFRVTFMRIRPDGKSLDPEDTYDGEWVGEIVGPRQKTLTGGGRPVIGLFGRKGNDLDAFGLVLGTAPALARPPAKVAAKAPAPVSPAAAPGLPPGTLRAEPVDAKDLDHGLIMDGYGDPRFETQVFKSFSPNINVAFHDAPIWPRGPKDNLSIRWKGYLRVPQTGVYEFVAANDDRMHFQLGEKVVMTGGIAPPSAPRSARLTLEKGLHRLQLDYVQLGGPRGMRLFWKASDEREMRIIGPEYFFHAKENAPPPPTAARKTAGRNIDKAYRADIQAAARNPSEKRSLADKLFDQAMKPETDPAGRYVLLERSRDYATEILDFPTAFRAIESMALHFEMEKHISELKAETLRAARKFARTPADLAVLATTSLALAEQLVPLNEFEEAVAHAKTAVDLAGKSRQPVLLKHSRTVYTELRDRLKGWEQFRKARETLDKNPRDERANLDAGLYLCLDRNDWERGLKHLAQSSDRLLRATARKDLAAPESEGEIAAVAEAWLKQTGRARGENSRIRYHWRARYWIDRVPDTVSGKAVREDLRKRLRAMEGRWAVDVLELIDPAKDKVSGGWSKAKGVLRSNGGGRLQVPYIPSEEYDLTLKMKRLGGSPHLFLGLVLLQKQFVVAFDDGSKALGYRTFLHSIPSSPRYSGRLIGDEWPRTIHCAVRKKTLKISVNGKVVLDWKVIPEQVWLNPHFAIPNKDVLLLATDGLNFEVSEMTLTPVSGLGKRFIR